MTSPAQNSVPAFFAQWAPILCTAAGVTPGHSVLDVGCGTGIVARAAADLVAPAGSVTGVDPNEAMLAVAGRVRPDLTWRVGESFARKANYYDRWLEGTTRRLRKLRGES